MNKRIQKKLARRSQPENEHNDAPVPSAVRIAARPSRSVVHRAQTTPQGSRAVQAVAKQARQFKAKNPLEAARNVAESVAKQVREKISEAEAQVRNKLSETEAQVREKISETEAQLKGRIAETEERAEALLEKVPVVGSKAAKKLHDLTHR